MAGSDYRVAHVAVSNTLIGVLMLTGRMIGLIGHGLGTAATVLVLGLLSLRAAAYILELSEAGKPS